MDSVEFSEVGAAKGFLNTVMLTINQSEHSTVNQSETIPACDWTVPSPGHYWVLQQNSQPPTPVLCPDCAVIGQQGTGSDQWEHSING